MGLWPNPGAMALAWWRRGQRTIPPENPKRKETNPEMSDFLTDMNDFLASQGIEYFSAHELCPVGRRANGNGPALKAAPRQLWPNIVPTLEVVEWLRGRIGGPIRVHSAYRDSAYNKAVGGASSSQHLQFRAMDISHPTVSPTEIAATLEKHPAAHTFGVGTYRTFVHIDTRGSRARW